MSRKFLKIFLYFFTAASIQFSFAFSFPNNVFACRAECNDGCGCRPLGEPCIEGGTPHAIWLGIAMAGHAERWFTAVAVDAPMKVEIVGEAAGRRGSMLAVWLSATATASACAYFDTDTDTNANSNSGQSFRQWHGLR